MKKEEQFVGEELSNHKKHKEVQGEDISFKRKNANHNRRKQRAAISNTIAINQIMKKCHTYIRREQDEKNRLT